jgi:hypothetical protein
MGGETDDPRYSSVYVADAINQWARDRTGRGYCLAEEVNYEGRGFWRCRELIFDERTGEVFVTQ